MIASATSTLVPAGARSQDAPPPLVIGVLTDKSGIGSAISGPPLVEAVRMAIADTSEMPDRRPISLVTEAFLRRPDDAVAIAQRWFDQGVSVIVDIPGTRATAAVQALARSRRRTTLVTGGLDPELTGQDCSPFGSSWTTDTTSIATALMQAAARNGAKTWYLVVPDTILGLAMESAALQVIDIVGGQVLGRSRHPSDETDFSAIIAQAKASGAQAVGLCDIVDGLRAQLPQFQAGGVFGGGRTVVAFLSSITDIHAAGAPAAKGMVTAAAFYWNQNEAARSFANRFIAKTGRMPDVAHACAYAAVRHYLRAVVVVEGLDADRVNQEMRRTPVYLFGRTARLRLDGRLAADLSLLRVKPPEAMHGPWDHYDQTGIVPASDIYPPLSQTGCRLGL